MGLINWTFFSFFFNKTRRIDVGAVENCVVCSFPSPLWESTGVWSQLGAYREAGVSSLSASCGRS